MTFLSRGDSMENMCSKILKRNDRYASENRAQLLESAAQDEAKMAQEKIVLIGASATKLRKQLQRESVMKARLQKTKELSRVPTAIKMQDYSNFNKKYDEKLPKLCNSSL